MYAVREKIADGCYYIDFLRERLYHVYRCILTMEAYI